jgi:hypothetical protein
VCVCVHDAAHDRVLLQSPDVGVSIMECYFRRQMGLFFFMCATHAGVLLQNPPNLPVFMTQYNSYWGATQGSRLVRVHDATHNVLLQRPERDVFMMLLIICYSRVQTGVWS